jgi:enamine deaminase RidA (YjgF/YER057c/UK114 family)
MSKIEEKLKSLGIVVPQALSPVANYVGFVKSGNQIFISGQLPIENGEVKYIGKVGSAVSAEDAKKAARLCALNIISQVKLACDGNLDKVVRCVKLGVFVNAEGNFTDHPAIANGASDLMVEVFGDVGKHARAAVGSGSLPRGVSVEIDAVFQID